MSQWLSSGNPESEALKKRLELLEIQFRKMHATQLLTRRHAYLAAATERLRAAGKTLRGVPEFRSQYGEDLLLYDLFDGKTDGFFFEAGAFNGVDFSVTFAFEQMGWTGLLVEPIPERAEECRVKRPYSTVVHAALGPSGAPSTVAFQSTEDQYGGMFSFVNSGSAHHKNLMSQPQVKKKEVVVPQVTVDSLLEQHKSNLDFAVIDVEDNEARVLAGFDLKRHRPRVVLLEDGSGGQNVDIRNAMAAHPYSLMGWVGINAVYIHNDERSLRERFVHCVMNG